MAQKTTPKKSFGDDPHFAQAVQNYEAGLRAMQEHKFDKAKGYLQKVLSGASKPPTMISHLYSLYSARFDVCCFKEVYLHFLPVIPTRG